MSTGIESIKLEIVRPGPRHGQLISRLTSYIALCEGVEADTISLPFAHHELTADIEALRYRVGGSGDARAVPNELREAAVERLSRRVAEVLEPMRGFQTRVAQVRGTHEVAHVRLILGGSELALIPFELAMGPTGWRAAGDKLVLQSRAPLVMTRELRDSSSRQLAWNRPPRVLVCSANPAGLSPPPLKQHVFVITQALAPATAHDRPISDMLTVLEDASIEKIEAELARRQYTHVHFICHGTRVSPNTDRWGLALCEDRKPSQMRVAEVLALRSALAPKDDASRLPTMVMLASCDGANQGAVEIPGASLAYELHQEGVPWVIASTLPLTYGGSWALAGRFYRGIFRGDDPRLALNAARVEMARQYPKAHDWASIVAYASFPDDFTEQLGRFKMARSRVLADLALRRLDRLGTEAGDESRAAELAQVDGAMQRWRRGLDEVRSDDGDWAEYWGMLGANTKRKAEALWRADTKRKPDEQPSRDSVEQQTQLLKEALGYYRQGVEKQKPNHWVACQCLSLCTLLSEEPPERLQELATEAALYDSHHGDRGQRTWAAASLLELCILDGKARGERDHLDWAREFMRLARAGSFEILSTQRQLNRYLQWWGQVFASIEGIARIVERAGQALPELAPMLIEQGRALTSPIRP